MRSLVVLATAWSLLGCPAPIETTPDGGTADAGARDGGSADSGGVDSGALDGGAPDSGAPDSGAGGGSADAGHLVASASTYCATQAEAWCASFERCGNMPAALGAHCRTQFTRNCDGAMGARLRTGAAGLNLPAAQACLDALTDRPCQSLDTRDESQVCQPDRLLKPAAMAGGACASPSDCLVGNCRRTNTLSCPACTPGAALGAPCQGFYDCDPHTARCATAADGGTGLQCGPRLADGAQCTRADDCVSESCYRLSPPSRCGKAADAEPCSIYSDRDCAAGHFCKQTSSGGATGICALRIADGQTCSDFLYDDGCATAGATCLGGKCMKGAPGTRALGTDCDDQFQCLAGLFCQGLTYGQSGSGICSAWLAPGAACNPSNGNPGCASGARCLNNQCMPLNAGGGPCTSSSQCGVFLACGAEGALSTCTGPAPLGQPCLRAAGCQEGYCDAFFATTMGTCRAFLDAGVRCSNAADVVINFICKSQSCYPGSDGGDFRECVDCLSGEF